MSNITFTKQHPGTQDAATGRFSGANTTTVTGDAIATAKGNPLTYQRLGLTPGEAPELFFIPDTYGDVPELDASAVWGGQTMKVKDVRTLAPDGVAIGAWVVVAR